LGSRDEQDTQTDSLQGMRQVQRLDTELIEMSLCALWLRFKTGRLNNRLDFLVGLEWRMNDES